MLHTTALFVNGLALGVPFASFGLLSSDLYSVAFPGSQLGVQVIACYAGAAAALQLLCHLADERRLALMSAAARIEMRLGACSALLGMFAVWAWLVVGKPAALGIGAHKHAGSLVLVLAAVCGAFDGVAVGAMYGEAAALGANATHALAAGAASALPLLAVLRITVKAAVAPTHSGLLLSIIVYFSLASVVLLGALMAYSCAVMPAVAALAAGCAHDDAPATLPLAPSWAVGSRSSSAGGSVTSQHQFAEAGSVGSVVEEKQGQRPRVQLSWVVPASKWAAPLLVRKVLTSSDATDLLGETLPSSADVVATATPSFKAWVSATAGPGQQQSHETKDALIVIAGAGCIGGSDEAPAKYGDMPALRRNWAALCDNWSYAVAAVLTHACTWGICPGAATLLAPSPVLGSTYTLLLVLLFSVGDLGSKLLPLWQPRRAAASIMVTIAVARLAVLVPAFALLLLFKAGPALVCPAVLLLSLSTWYVTAIFDAACYDNRHADDAFLVESLLAILGQAGIAVGAIFSLIWAVGPWAAGRTWLAG